MAVNFASYEIARSGLFVNERGLYVTGQNISNVNTPGYVRQQAMMTTAQYRTDYTKYGLQQFGLGADIQQVRQIRNVFLDNIYRQESVNLGYWQAKSNTFQDVQAVLAEPMNSGLQDTLNQFWDSWQELSKEPDSLTIRALVTQRGGALVQQVNHMGEQLDRMQNDLNSEIGVRINQINDITRQIAKLNVTILKTEISGDTANDYRDQRNNLVDQLTSYINCNVNEMQDGQLDITQGGYFLVQKGVSTDLYAGQTTASGLFNVPMLAGTTTQIPIKGGELKGLLESRGEVQGMKGSISNGSPMDKIDMVFAVNRNATAAQLANMQANIINSANQLYSDYQARGIDVRFGLTTFDDAGNTAPTFYTNTANFQAAVNGITTAAGVAPLGLEALHSAEGMPFRMDALKQVVLVTNSALDTTTYSVNTIKQEMDDAGIGVTVIGDTAAGVQTQLQPLEQTSGSAYYDINAPAFGTFENDIYTQMKDDIYNNVFSTQNIISDVRNQLNLLINVLAREVNSLHRSGTTLDGVTTGVNFFVPINNAYPMEMGNITLNPVLEDVNYIAASLTGQKGDNTIALNIANLRSSQLVGKTGALLSLDEFYRSIISYVGNNGSDAVTIADNQQKLVDAADASRQAITGVSMDEEMTNMMKYKFAYDASSRVINILDTMLGTVVERMGLTGR